MLRRPDDACRGRALGLLGLLVALMSWGGVVGGPAPAAAATPAPLACETQASGATLAVVVVFGSGATRARCTEPGGTGIDVLRRAGFAPVTQGYGSVEGESAVCAIRDPDTGTVQGCESGPSCLTCLAPESWSYFPGYRYSQVGAGSTQPGAGTVEAWHWGRSTSWSGDRPSASDVCDPPDPEPPATTPTTTRPSTGNAVPRPGDPGPGGGGTTPGPGGSTPDDPGGSSTTGPGGSTTTAPGATSTTAPGDEATTTTEAAEVEDRTTERDGTDREEAGGVLTVPADGPDGGGSGGGAPVVPLVVTVLVVAAVAGLALRARRARASGGASAPA